MSQTVEDTREALLAALRQRFNATQLKPVVAALNAAERLHAGQLRGTGEPYVCHPMTVATILCEWGLDLPTIIAAVLHDVLEDTEITLPELQSQFGKEVAELVESVTKLSAIRIPQADITYEVENLRRLFLAMAKDLRVVLLKLADRLHNIRTIKGMPPQKRPRYGRETLEVYAPLADRLGMGEVRSELQDAGFQYSNPTDYQWTQRQVQAAAKRGDRYLTLVKRKFQETLSAEGITARIDARTKNLYSLYRKLLEKERDIDKVYDLFAIRVIVETVEQCYQGMGIIHRHWQPLPHRIKDYIAVPKLNGYRSLHTTIFGPEQKLLEVQFRTVEMHEEAERGVAAHTVYAEQKRSVSATDEQMAVMKQLKSWQDEISESTEFVQKFKLDLFSDRLFVFTPQGSLHSLSSGSTPVDFAFAVHTEVGNTCRGAKLNGVIVPLDTKLSNGDVVEILTQAGSTPKQDWLTFVRTGHARSSIRRYFREQSRADKIAAGTELLRTALKPHKLTPARLNKSQQGRLLAVIPDSKEPDDVLAALGEGRTTSGALLAALGLVTEASVSKVAKKPSRPGRAARVSVVGMHDLQTKLSNCCHPKPPQPIVGYVTTSKAVSIHRESCGQVRHLKDSSRLLAAAWQY